MTATALDAALALLLLGGAVATVTVPPAPASDGAPRADATLEALATTTATVNYTLAPGARRARASPVSFPRTAGPAFRRTSHGSRAELLARAVRAQRRLDGQPITHTGASFRAAVRGAVADLLGPGTQVVAVWRPYRGSSLRGRLAVGPAPPPGADVHVAALLLPRSGDRATPSGGFRGVARAIARRVVADVFPPERTRLALRDDYPLAALVAHRYYRFAAAYGADLGGAPAAGDARAANRRLAAAVAERVAGELRRGFDTPARAAATARPGRVRIVVRAWSA